MTLLKRNMTKTEYLELQRNINAKRYATLKAKHPEWDHQKIFDTVGDIARYNQKKYLASKQAKESAMTLCAG